MQKKVFLTLLFSFFALKVRALEFAEKRAVQIEQLELFQKAYPDVRFHAVWDFCKKDYLVFVHFPSMPECETVEFYWAGGRLLPEDKRDQKEKSSPILYFYPESLVDPAEMTAEQLGRLKENALAESAENALGSPMYFYDYLYDSFERKNLESHIKEIPYLGLSMKIHERIEKNVRNVEKRIFEAAKTSSAVRKFLQELTIDAFFWRVIKGTERKSFHSLGIAIDVLPKNLHGKASYWAWTRDKIGDGWMFLPFSERWFPPREVIDAFEAEGFVWGGKWGIWDNMHFEYRPELVLFNQKYNRTKKRAGEAKK